MKKLTVNLNVSVVFDHEAGKPEQFLREALRMLVDGATLADVFNGDTSIPLSYFSTRQDGQGAILTACPIERGGDLDEPMRIPPYLVFDVKAVDGVVADLLDDERVRIEDSLWGEA